MNKNKKGKLFTFPDSSYSQACKFLELDHHVHSSYEKSWIEITIQHINDRIDGFDDYFPCRKKNCTKACKTMIT